MAALFAWMDQEHEFSKDTIADELPFFVDPVHLDAYAETLDARDWRTIARQDGRAFYGHLARQVVARGAG